MKASAQIALLEQRPFSTQSNLGDLRILNTALLNPATEVLNLEQTVLILIVLYFSIGLDYLGRDRIHTWAVQLFINYELKLLWIFPNKTTTTEQFLILVRVLLFEYVLLMALGCLQKANSLGNFRDSQSSRQEFFSFPPFFSMKTAFPRNWGFRGGQETSENVYQMYINAGEPSPANPSVRRYFAGRSMEGFRGGPANSSDFFSNTKWGRISWPFPWKCRDGTRPRNSLLQKPH